MLSARDLAGIQATLAAELPDQSTINATLLELRGPAARDMYGQVADQDAGTLMWSGEVGAYLRRNDTLDNPDRSNVVSSQGATVTEQDELVVLRFALPEAAEAIMGGNGEGWTVVFDDLRAEDPVRRSARVSGVASWGQAALADKVRFLLADERDVP